MRTDLDIRFKSNHDLSGFIQECKKIGRLSEPIASKILNKYDCTNFIKNSHTYLLNGETFKFDLVYPGISKGEFKNKIRYDVSVTVYK